ncbi:hypothetical protein BsWGS_23593, partial [Bradybaena similaris]
MSMQRHVPITMEPSRWAT